MKKLFLSLIIILFIVLVGYNLYVSKNTNTEPVTDSQNQVTNTSTTTATSTTQLANPASKNCIEKGGSLQMQTREDGGQYGLCYFDDARACEEWAMFRGECQVGGVKTTGYDTVDQKFCAWSGGRTLAVENSQCTFPSGKVCSTVDFYKGTCTK